MVALIDFDGTITKENKYPEIGEFRPYVSEAINNMQKCGWICCLWTCREGESLKQAIQALERHGIHMDFINQSPYSDFNRRKPVADIYIDDASYPNRLIDGCLIDWVEIEKNLCKNK